MISTVERAQHRWREILPLVGIDTRYLTNRHGPCPACGGKDRFRFDDRDGNGSYYCNQCGPGNGITLIRRLKGWDFKTAADEIDRILGDVGNAQPAPDATARNKGNSSALARVERALADARNPDVVSAYLQRRGLSATSAVLRGDLRCPYFDTATQNLVGYFPAIIAPIVSVTGELRSAQRIYDSPDVPERKKTMRKIAGINGAAVQLFEPSDVLAVTEGIENALAVYEMFGHPAWAALSDTGIATFEPPPGLRELLIYGDNDKSFAGQAAAYALAKRLRNVRALEVVEVHLPPIAGTDWLDVLNGREAT